MTGLLPAVRTFCEWIFVLWCIMTTARENLFKSAFKVWNTFLELNPHPKQLFSGGSDNPCLALRLKTMNFAVEWQRLLPPESVSNVECLIKKDPRMAHAERDTMRILSGSLLHILHDCLGVGNVMPVGCSITWMRSRSWVGWTGAPTCWETLMEEGPPASWPS